MTTIILGIFEEGLVYAIMALGVYMSLIHIYSRRHHEAGGRRRF